MKKRSSLIVIVMLSMMLAFTAFSGCIERTPGIVRPYSGTLPHGREIRVPEYPLARFDETITINVLGFNYPAAPNIPGHFNPRNQSFNNLALEHLNVRINYVDVVAPAQYDTRLDLLIATGQMPDLFMTSDPVVFELLRNAGRLADLAEPFYYLNESLQRMYLEDFYDTLRTAMVEGALYSFPVPANPYEFAKRIYIRRDWMEIAGWGDREPPATAEELLDLARAFRQHDAAIAATATGVNANQIVPIAMHRDLNFIDNWGPTGLFEMFGAQRGAFFEGSDGQLYSSNTSQEMRNAVAAMADMRREGLISPEFYNLTSTAVANHITAGRIGIIFGDWWVPEWPLGTSVTNAQTPDAEWISIPMVGAGGNPGRPIVTPIAVSTYNMVSRAFVERNPQHRYVLPRLLNLFYDIFYNDDAYTIYGIGATPEGGFFHNWMPVRLWNSSASISEHHRVRRVFDELWETGYRWNFVESELSGAAGTAANNAMLDAEIARLTACEEEFGEIFRELRVRERNLHFRRGWHYFQAAMSGTAIRNMTPRQRDGWGIYTTMISLSGGYAHVAALSEGRAEAKYNMFYGTATPAMRRSSASLDSQLNRAFARIIIGTDDIDRVWNTIVRDYERNGGREILREINEWHQAGKHNA